MQGFKECGDIKAVGLTIYAIAYFHKTVQDFLSTVKSFTPEQKTRYCELLVAEYQQFQDVTQERVATNNTNNVGKRVH